MESILELLTAMPRGLLYVVIGILALVGAKNVRDLTTSYSIENLVTKDGNAAVAIRLCGYLTGVILIFVGALYQPVAIGGVSGAVALLVELAWVAGFTLGGIVLLNLMRPLADKIVLHKFDTNDQVVSGGNVGVATAEAGMSIAVGLVVAGALAGEGGMLALAAFLALGLANLILFALFYEWTTPFDVQAELQNGNTAVGITLGANLVAIGLVVFKASFGEFLGWGYSMTAYAIYSVSGFLLLYLLRLAADLLMLPTTRISRRVGEGAVSVAYVEGAVVVCASLILLFSI